MNLIERIKAFQEEFGTPTAFIAKKFGYNYQYFYNWFAGRVEPSKRLKKMVDEWISKYGY